MSAVLKPKPRTVAADVRHSDIYQGQRGRVGSLPWSSKLKDIIRPGTVLVYARMIRLPSELILKGWPFGRWSVLGGIDATRLERELRSRGWQLRRWSRARAWGISLAYDTALSTALNKLTSRVEAEWRNALEIKKVSVFRLLKIHVVRVSAEPVTVYWSRQHGMTEPLASASITEIKKKE